MGTDVTNHMDRDVGSRGERVIDALSTPSRQNIGGREDYAIARVGNTGSRNADAGDRHSTGFCRLFQSSAGAVDQPPTQHCPPEVSLGGYFLEVLHLRLVVALVLTLMNTVGQCHEG